MTLWTGMKREMLSKPKRIERLISKEEEPETDAVDGKSFPPENATGDNNAMTRVEQIENYTYQMPMRLINLLEKPANWKKRSLYKNKDIDTKAKELYSEVHQNPVLYKNLYEYLIFR